jgi:hypothetical protein
MTNTFVKGLATIATLVAFAAVGNVQTAQANHSADDPAAHATTPPTAAVAPNAATPATTKPHTVRYHHRARHSRTAVHRPDDNSRPPKPRGADDNRPRGNGADDAQNHR